MVMEIRKRTGDVVHFDKTKIYDAVLKAFHSVGLFEFEHVESVTEEVVKKVIARTTAEKVPSVEEVQDLVEEVLISQGHAKAAKSYILYREKRREVREAVKQGIIEKGFSGKLNVLKRAGETEHFDLEKVRNKFDRVTYGFEEAISHDLILRELMKNVFEGIKSAEIDKALILQVHLLKKIRHIAMLQHGFS